MRTCAKDYQCISNTRNNLWIPSFQSGNRSTRSIVLNLSYGISQLSNLAGIANISPSGNSSNTSNASLNSFWTYPLLFTDVEENNAIKNLLFLMAFLISRFQVCPGNRSFLSNHNLKSVLGFRSS